MSTGGGGSTRSFLLLVLSCATTTTAAPVLSAFLWEEGGLDFEYDSVNKFLLVLPYMHNYGYASRALGLHMDFFSLSYLIFLCKYVYSIYFLLLKNFTLPLCPSAIFFLPFKKI